MARITRQNSRPKCRVLKFKYRHPCDGARLIVHLQIIVKTIDVTKPTSFLTVARV